MSAVVNEAIAGLSVVITYQRWQVPWLWPG